MSRLYGRMFDLYAISNELNNIKLCRYNPNNKRISWKELDNVKEDVEEFLSIPTKDILFKNDINAIGKFNLFDKVATTAIPMFGDAPCDIIFPSNNAKFEYKREMAYFLGMILSNFNFDLDKDTYGVPNEYDDVIPLVIEYLYMKKNNIDGFLLKRMNELKRSVKDYIKKYNEYQKLEDTNRIIKNVNVSDEAYDSFKKAYNEKTNEMLINTSIYLTKVASLEGALKIIDRSDDKEFVKDIIEELTLNVDNERAKIMVNNDLDSFKFRRLRKEFK